MGIKETGFRTSNVKLTFSWFNFVFLLDSVLGDVFILSCLRGYKRNGFQNPRKHDKMKTSPSTLSSKKTKLNQEYVNLTFDFISDNVSNIIKNEVKRLKLPFRINFVANNKLKNKLCCSRPYDKKTCKINKCRICPKIESNNNDCSLKNAVYRVDCKICGQFYIGETERTLHERMGEHLRYASYPKTPSNRN